MLVIAHEDSLPGSLERLQFSSGRLICSAFGVGGESLACASDERGDDANNGHDVSKWFHGFKCPAAGCVGCQKFVKRL